MRSTSAESAYIGFPKRYYPGNPDLQRGLWLCLLLPGLLYTLWRWAGSYRACPKCGKRAMIRFDTPAGRAVVTRRPWPGVFIRS